MTSRKLVVGNWKMHGLSHAVAEAQVVAEALEQAPPYCRVAICPPATLIHRMAQALSGTRVEVGAQDAHHAPHGAHTGDVCAEMLHDAGASLVILGHSERRGHHRESDFDVAAKVKAALRAGLEPIVCVGETADQRRAGEHLRVVRAQVEGSLPPELDGRPFAVSYEPVWAIGSGVTPTVEEIEAVHALVREVLSTAFPETGAAAPILYGGSVKPANAAEILQAAEVGGALVGGASLKAADFLPIIRAA
jgi:triosephosphate isomerase